jgi:hypothetical protein
VGTYFLGDSGFSLLAKSLCDFQHTTQTNLYDPPKVVFHVII